MTPDDEVGNDGGGNVIFVDNVSEISNNDSEISESVSQTSDNITELVFVGNDNEIYDSNQPRCMGHLRGVRLEERGLQRGSVRIRQRGRGCG